LVHFVPNVNLCTRFKNSWNYFELSHWHVGSSIDLRLLDTETYFGTLKDRWDLLGSSHPIRAHKFQPSSPVILPVPVKVSLPPLPPPSRRWARLGRTMFSQHVPLDKSGTHPVSSLGDPASRWLLRPAGAERSPPPPSVHLRPARDRRSTPPSSAR
jgi:hypothetical protein